MRSKYLLAPVLSLSLLGLLPVLSGCDSLKEKLGMEAKKEEKSDDKKKKKDKDDEEEGDDDKKAEGAASGTASAQPAAGGGSSAPANLPGATKSASHLPGDCEVAISFNLGKVLGHPSFSKEVVPALEEALKKATSNGPDGAKADAFLKETGIGVKTFTDMAMCLKDVDAGDPTFAFALAGDLKADVLIPALEKADSSVSSKIKDIDGRKAISDSEVVMGQLADGSVAAAKTEDLFKSMAATNDNAVSKYKLDTGKELSFSVSEALLTKSMAGGGAGAPPELKSVKSLSGALDLAGGKIALRVGTGSADEAKKLESMFNLMKTELGSQMAGAPPGTAEILKGATTKIDGNDLVVESTFPTTTVDSLATLMAQGIKSEADKIKLPSGGADPAKPADPKAAAAPPPAKTAAAPPPPAKTVAAPPPPPKTAAPPPKAPPPPPKPKERTKR